MCNTSPQCADNVLIGNIDIIPSIVHARCTKALDVRLVLPILLQAGQKQRQVTKLGEICLFSL